MTPPWTVSFTSDNIAGASPEVVAAVAACNAGTAKPYGNDDFAARANAKLAEVFERPVDVFLVPSGTAANALALAVLTPPWGGVVCHREAHINTDECGAPEFFTHGAKLLPLDGADAKLAAAAVRAALAGEADLHVVRPSCVSITQITETGALYSVDEVAEISRACAAAGVALHMDGARFANAVAALGCTPADLTWKAGVAALSFGTIKNGTINADALVLFDDRLAGEAALRRKRAGHLASKMRFAAAQIEAYLEDDLWLRNARHANAMAARLEAGLARVPGVGIVAPAAANILFCKFPQALSARLLAEGYAFYHDRWAPGVARLVCSFATTADEVDAFVAAAVRLA